MTIRMLDHVEQVRVVARASLAALLVGDERRDLTVRALEVVLAGRSRSRGEEALAAVEEIASRIFEEAEYVDLLMRASPREVRRHGFGTADQLGLMTVPRLLDAVRHEEDQLVVARCAEWLYRRGEPSDFADLLNARSAILRQASVLRVDDLQLPDDLLLPLLADRAPRVREAARHRARRRGVDVAAWYRLALTSAGTSGLAVAILDGLLISGDTRDLATFEHALSDPRPRVRSIAVRGVARWASGSDTAERLAPMLIDPSSRVSTTVARVLARVGAPAATAADAWVSSVPGSRRAAWFLARSGGGWDAVEADLRLATDTDDALAGLGRAQVMDWLTTRAATTWQPLSDRQRLRLVELLERWDASVEVKRQLAFHAGVRPRPTANPEVVTPARRSLCKRRHSWLLRRVR